MRKAQILLLATNWSDKVISSISTKVSAWYLSFINHGLSLIFLKWEIAFHENIYLSWPGAFSQDNHSTFMYMKSFLCRLHFVTQNIKCIVKRWLNEINNFPPMSVFIDTLFFCIWWRINAVTVHTVDCHSLQFYPPLLFHQCKYQHR